GWPQYRPGRASECPSARCRARVPWPPPRPPDQWQPLRSLPTAVPSRGSIGIRPAPEPDRRRSGAGSLGHLQGQGRLDTESALGSIAASHPAPQNSNTLLHSVETVTLGYRPRDALSIVLDPHPHLRRALCDLDRGGGGIGMPDDIRQGL